MYDTDDLKSGNGLLGEAYKVGLIDIQKRDRCKSLPEEDRPATRKAILDDIGWLGAEECLEEEVCNSGYLAIVLGVIQNNDPDHHSDQKAFEKYVNGQPVNPKLVAQFIKKRTTLKIPVAQKIASTAHDAGCVPKVYENAIRKAVLLSQRGLQVDEFFEARAWASGYKNLIVDFLHSNSLYDKFTEFCNGTAKNIPAPIQILGFAKSEYFTAQLRGTMKSKIAGAIKACGCLEYAEVVRNTPLPEG